MTTKRNVGSDMMAVSAAQCYMHGMGIATELELPRELASELEKKFFWWKPADLRPRSHARILAQAMEFASYEDVQRLEKIVGADRLVDTMLGAEPGWISERSWEFWRGRLALTTGRSIPDAPVRRSFDVGKV